MVGTCVLYSPGTGLQSERRHFDPGIRAELRPDHDSIVVRICDGLGLEALGRAVKVSVQHRVADDYFVKAVV